MMIFTLRETNIDPEKRWLEDKHEKRWLEKGPKKFGDIWGHWQRYITEKFTWNHKKGMFEGCA